MSILFLIFLVIGVIVVWVTSGYLLYDLGDANKVTNLLGNLGDRGTFGDMFGAVNSLFTGLAFAGLIYTILLQKEELSLQREELKLTRGELQGQKETMQAHNKQIALQNFEGTFFQMLRLHNDLLNSIDIMTGGQTRHGGSGSALKVHSGRDCFSIIWAKYESLFQKNIQDENYERKMYINGKFKNLWTEYENEIGHYFRSLYHIVKFIDNSKIENKKHYTNIVRAQLSGQELIIIFYNCIYFSNLKFKPLIEKYSLLKHLPSKKYLDRDKEMIDLKAYNIC